jgi:hypothetical protein
MTTAALARPDRRSHDLITLPRAATEESWIDVQAVTFEVRQSVAKAYVAEKRGSDPLPHLFEADRRLVRLNEYARRQAGEVAGLVYIDREQQTLWDGCGPDGRAG